MSGQALVISHTLLGRDPRVAREVDWLVADGWVVDTVGRDAEPLAGVRTHFEFAPEARWLRPIAMKTLLHSLVPYPLRFRLLMESRLPREVVSALQDDRYDLVLVNDIQLLRLIDNLPSGSRRVHIDLHELHAPDLAAHIRGARLVNGFFRWTRRAIASPLVASTSVVARGIAEAYRDEFGIAQPTIIRNCPAYEQIEPSPVNDECIELVYHGAATWARGLDLMIDAVAQLPERFRLNLILVGGEAIVAEVKDVARAALGERLSIHEPVPVVDIARYINRFDIEVMFFPPVTESLRYALPNKLFEAAQARLGMVIGPSPMMAELIDEHDMGVIVGGWTAEDLAGGLVNLSRDDIERFKRGAAGAAAVLNSDHEHAVFRSVVTPFLPKGTS